MSSTQFIHFGGAQDDQNAMAAFLQKVYQKRMDIKRVFGVILTMLGIAGLIYAAVLFMNTEGGSKQIKALVVYGILGSVFFFTGVGLIRTTHDDRQPPVR